MSTIAIMLMASRALSAQEADPSAVRSRAISLEQQGQTKEAEQIWSNIATGDPQNAEALAHLGLLEARQEHYGAAIDFYHRALAIDASLPGLQTNLGLALFKAAQFPDAIRAFSAEIKKHPGDPRLTLLLGMAHFGMKDYLVAIPYLQRAVEQDSPNVTLRITLAQSCMHSSQFHCVVEMQKAIEALNASSAEADMLAGEALAQMQDVTAAENEFRKAILKDQKKPRVHFGLGYLLWSESKWSESADEFQLELQNDPHSGDAQVFLGDSWVRQNEFAKALAVLSTLTGGQQPASLLHRDLGIIYAHDGRTEDAVRELIEAIDADPEDPEPHLQLAKVYRATNKQSEADRELRSAQKLHSQSVPYLVEAIDTAEAAAP